MKFQHSVCNPKPVIEDVIEDELEGEDVKVEGQLVEVDKAVELPSKSLNLFNWVNYLSLKFEGVKLVLKLAELPTSFSLICNFSLWPVSKIGLLLDEESDHSNKAVRKTPEIDCGHKVSEEVK